VDSAPPQARPRAEFVTALPPGDILQRFAAALQEPGCPVVGQLVDGHIELFVPDAERHFWSPWLSLEVRTAVDGTHVRGRFGPHPHVWTGFIAAYSALGFGGIIAAMYGWAQLLIDEPAWGLLGVPAALAIAAFVYGAEWIGKGLGTEQMFGIRDFVVSVIEPGDRA
jgi:hypothetical protein